MATGGDGAMGYDACSLVGDLLPLYADDLLSPESRRFVEEHAAGCAKCGAELEGLRQPTPPAAPPDLEVSDRRLVPRLRRLLMLAMAGLLAVLVGVSGMSYLMGRATRPIASDQKPLRVKNAEELAARVVPGWSRAVEQGLVVPLGLTQRVPGTEAWITLEQGWFSGRQGYLLYTVKAPKGKHVLPSFGYLTRADGEVIYDGGVEWVDLRRSSGFSIEGHHGVIVLDGRQPPPEAGSVQLRLGQWLPVTPQGASDQQVGEELSLTIPWQADYLRTPAPAVMSLSHRQTWLGRTLTLAELRVGTGSMQLTGLIDLPEGESNPGLHGWLLVGGAGTVDEGVSARDDRGVWSVPVHC